MRRALLFAVLILLAGCTNPLGFGPREDPEDDAIGWENGYWHDDRIDVTPDDGYNESERAAVVARTMARVEELRGLEFEESVPVDVISREEYLADRNESTGSATYEAWNNQVWEGLFLVDEDSNVSAAFNATYGTSVQGYYAPGDGQIVLVSDSATPTIDRATLAHELLHALQDQHFGLGGSPDTQDRQLAADSVTEGEANYVEQLYQNRCGPTWQCIPEPPAEGGAGLPDDFNRGVYMTIFQPYATGPDFVHEVRDRSGWDGVDALHDEKPTSTEQVIHPETYPDEAPVNVTVADRSGDDWRRFDNDPEADTVGEASVYAMLLSNDAVDVGSVYEYESEPSAGWGGDALVPYTNGSHDAYVWETRWDTEADAREFREAYLAVLDGRDAENVRGNVYVIPEHDPFDDAFRVVRDGDTVRVVNAPDVDTLPEIHRSN